MNSTSSLNFSKFISFFSLKGVINATPEPVKKCPILLLKLFWFNVFFESSAICTAFVAAPFLILSVTTQRFTLLSVLKSLLIFWRPRPVLLQEDKHFRQDYPQELFLIICQNFFQFLNIKIFIKFCWDRVRI